MAWRPDALTPRPSLAGLSNQHHNRRKRPPHGLVPGAGPGLQGVDVGRRAATNLLLLQESLVDERARDNLCLMLELDAQPAWRKAAPGS